MITLKLTPLQAKALYTLADEGAQGLLTAGSEAAARAYVGNAKAQQAAREALDLLSAALHRRTS
jgi:hypothetical protein